MKRIHQTHTHTLCIPVHKAIQQRRDGSGVVGHTFCTCVQTNKCTHRRQEWAGSFTSHSHTHTHTPVSQNSGAVDKFTETRKKHTNQHVPYSCTCETCNTKKLANSCHKIWTNIHKLSKNCKCSWPTSTHCLKHIFTAAKQSGHTCTCIAENIWPVKDHCIHTIKSVVGISMVFTIRTVQAVTLAKQPRCYTTQEKYM